MGKIVVDTSKTNLSLNFRELFNYRDLFWVLAYRDYRIRYAQTFLGFLWAFLQPFATLVIFTLVFGKAAKVDTGDVPYPLFAVCGMVAWTFFAYVMNQSGNSIITSQNMIKKIYFPRLILPISKAVVGTVDFAITSIFVIILLVYYNILPSSNIIYLPIFILMLILTALGVGIWLSALTIRYRDFQHLIPFIVQFGLYATPVAYPAEILVNSLPRWASVIYFLNPMAGVIGGFRWAILGVGELNLYSYISFVVIILIFIGGLYYFKKVERIMADIV